MAQVHAEIVTAGMDTFQFVRAVIAGVMREFGSDAPVQRDEFDVLARDGVAVGIEHASADPAVGLERDDHPATAAVVQRDFAISRSHADVLGV